MKTVSANEAQGLLAKAARGAGAPPAQANAFGQAGAYFLASGGRIEVLNDALEQIPAGPVLQLFTHIQDVMGGGECVAFTLRQGADMALLPAYLDAMPFANTRVSPTEFQVNCRDFGHPALPARLQVCEQALQRWKAFAAKTFVPETEQSRIAGAGAGLTDND